MIKSRTIKWGRACNTNWENGNAFSISVGKPQGKRPLGRPKCRCLNNIKIDLKGDRMGWHGLD
jgi:hypothetical protein